MDNIVDFINVNRDRYVDELKRSLAIPSISALPAHAGDVRKGAEWTADEMRRIGLQDVRVEETPGHPAVYGEWLGADGAPTILYYGHYDVQPVDPLNLWTSPPFEATVRDGEIYARGAVDDKGQVFMHFKAVEAHLKQNGRLPVNMKFLIEGEEEVGSANLDNYVREHKERLKADVVVISDSPISTAASRRFATACAASPIFRSTCAAAERATCIPDRSAAPSPTRRWCSPRSWHR